MSHQPKEERKCATCEGLTSMPHTCLPQEQPKEECPVSDIGCSEDLQGNCYFCHRSMLSPSQPNEQWVDRTFKEILAGAEFAEEMERECLRHMEKMLIKAIASRDSEWKAAIEGMKKEFNCFEKEGRHYECDCLERESWNEALSALLEKMSNPKDSNE